MTSGRKRKRTDGIVSVIVMVALLANQIGFGFPAGKAYGQSGLRQLVLISKPSGAAVYIDGRLVGATPFSGRLPTGTHTFRVVLEGYLTWSQDIELSSDRRILVELDSRASRRDRGWIWTLLGVVVAGGAAVGALVVIRNRVSNTSRGASGELPGGPPSPP